MYLFPVFFALGLSIRGTEGSLAAQTSQGIIIGHPSPSHPDVVEYLGIPYAEPPVGELRFEVPQPYSGQSRYVASHYGFDCPYTRAKPIDYPDRYPQFDNIMQAFTSQNTNNQSEDCLTLNIWNNRGRHTSPKPVLIHFHGGRWTAGTTNTPFYDGSTLAFTGDMVVVTATYRMNIFGFPGIPETQSNLGLLDMRIAVEWVRDHIAAFGGDPTRIVMSGQSCGSAAADYWAYAYPEDPIVTGLISHSGTAASFPANTPELSAQHWDDVTSLLGCGSEDTLTCMKRQNVSALLDAAGQIQPPPTSSPARKQPIFQPTIDNVTVFGDYLTLGRAGRFARLPYLVGHNDNEAGFYKISAFAQDSILSESTWETFNQETFTCPTDIAAAARLSAGVPVWRFRYLADWNNTRLYPTSGAYHGVDLNLVFGNSELVTGIPNSPGQLDLQRLMQRAWSAFVADPEHGLDGLGWPRFSFQKKSVIGLGLRNDPTVTLLEASGYNAGCWNRAS